MKSIAEVKTEVAEVPEEKAMKSNTSDTEVRVPFPYGKGARARVRRAAAPKGSGATGECERRNHGL